MITRGTGTAGETGSGEPRLTNGTLPGRRVGHGRFAPTAQRRGDYAAGVPSRSEARQIRARDVLAELCGAKPAGAFVHLTHLPSFDAVEVIARAFARPVRRLEALGLGEMSSRDLLTGERSAGEPEARAARQVGEGSIVFTAICYHLWGRSLSAERDARVAASLPNAASASTVRAKRGRVSRELVAEIRAFIKRAEES